MIILNSESDDESNDNNRCKNAKYDFLCRNLSRLSSTHCTKNGISYNQTVAGKTYVLGSEKTCLLALKIKIELLAPPCSAHL